MLHRTLRFIALALITMGPLTALQQPLQTIKQVKINFPALQKYQPQEQKIALQVDSEEKDAATTHYYLKAANTARGQRYLLVVQRLDGALVIKAPVKVKKDGTLTRTDRDERVEIPVDRVFPGERMECFLVSENGQCPLAKIGFTPHPIIAWLSDGPSVSANLMDLNANHYLILGKNFSPNESVHIVTTWGEQKENLDITTDASGAFRTIFSPMNENQRGGVSSLSFESSLGTINFRLPWGAAYFTWAVHAMKPPVKKLPTQSESFTQDQTSSRAIIDLDGLLGGYLMPKPQQL